MLSLSLLVLGASIDMEAGRRENNNLCNPCFDCPGVSGLAGVRGTIQSTGFNPPSIDSYGVMHPGSETFTTTSGCGFNIGNTLVCVYDVTNAYPTVTQPYNSSFVYQYSFDTRINYNTPLCKTPSVLFENDFTIPALYPPSGDICQPTASNVVYNEDGSVLAVVLQGASTNIANSSKTGFNLATIATIAVYVNSLDPSAQADSLAIANAVVYTFITGINPLTGQKVRNAVSTDFIAAVEERCCEA